MGINARYLFESDGLHLIAGIHKKLDVVAGYIYNSRIPIERWVAEGGELAWRCHPARLECAVCQGGDKLLSSCPGTSTMPCSTY